MKYINSEVFGITFGFFFAIPTAHDIFLKYVAPIILQNSSEFIIYLLILIIEVLIFVLPLIIWYKLIKKYYVNMRGIRTMNHERNIIFSVILGAILGLIVQRIIF
jgi:hypothetical protein